MEETAFVFLVDLGYRCSRDTVVLQDSGGLLTSRVVFIVIVVDYLALGLGSASGVWAEVPGMYGTHLKYRQCLFYQFQ